MEILFRSWTVLRVSETVSNVSEVAFSSSLSVDLSSFILFQNPLLYSSAPDLSSELIGILRHQKSCCTGTDLTSRTVHN